jgi:hypothetical protein
MGLPLSGPGVTPYQTGWDAYGREKQLWEGPFACPMDGMMSIIQQHADIPCGWDITEEALGIEPFAQDPFSQSMGHAGVVRHHFGGYGGGYGGGNHHQFFGGGRQGRLGGFRGGDGGGHGGEHGGGGGGRD